MKKMKKTLALLLAVVMVVGIMAGCSNNETPQGTQPAQTQAAQTQGTTAQPAQTTPADEEPVKLQFMINTEIVEGSIGDKWIDEIEEHCNVEIEWVSPAASAYEENLQLMLLDDERPDAVIFPTTWLDDTTFADACQDGLFISLEDMLPNYPNIMAHTAAVSWDGLDIFDDGHIWGVPRSTVMRADGFALNENWLKNLNIDYHEGDFLTTDEFFDILYAFTYDDPDGNGADDTYGLMGYSLPDGTLITSLQHIFGIGTGSEFFMMDGKPEMLKYSREYDNYKRYLAFANKCWEAGVIDPDAFSIDLTVATDRRTFGTVGCYSTYPGTMTVVATDDFPETYVYCPGVVENEGDTFGYGEFATGIYWYWAINSQCEHPEKVLEVFDYILSDEQWTNLNAGSVEGFGFDITADGNYDFSKTAALKEQGLDKIDPIKLIMRRSDGAEFFIDKSLPIEQQQRLADLISVSFDLYVAPVDEGYVPEIATDPTFIEYKNFVIQAEAKIISGTEPVDYWDEVVDGWYDAGGTQYIEQVLAYINK